MNIITTTQLQKDACRLVREDKNSTTIILHRGKPKAVLLPYIPNGEDIIEQYLKLKKYELRKNPVKAKNTSKTTTRRKKR